MAVLNDEPEAMPFVRLFRAASGTSFISAGNVIETHRVMTARATRTASTQVDRFIAHSGMQVAPVDAAKVAFAREGMERLGKGRGAAPAVLNFGDLFAYALARSLETPFLFKGENFAETDLEPAWRG